MKTTTIYILLSSVLLLLLSACAPVHRFTRLKKVPLDYSFNYRGSEIKAPRTDLNKEPWIVFSDREKNQTFTTPQGKVKAQEVGFLDAFLVIGKKGRFLKLIKYTPDILKNGMLQYKEAEYCGWMDKSTLLLNRQSYTDVASGKKNKTLVAFSDTRLLDQPDTYFGTDSLWVFKDLTASSVNSGVAPFSVVYRLKESTDRGQTLIAGKPYIKAEEVGETVLGWIDNSFLQDIGTGLHVDFPKTAKDTVHFIVGGSSGKSHLSPVSIFENRLLSDQYPVAKYNPVSVYNQSDSLTSYRIGFPLPVFDKKENFVLTINGGSITYRDFGELADNLKKINISFVFEGREETIKQLSRIVNSLQNLQSLFDDTGDYTYNFSCVTNFFDTKESDSRQTPALAIELQPDYAAIINYLTEKADNQADLKPLSLSKNGDALRLAVSSFDLHKEATNLVVVIGEKGDGGFEKSFYEQVVRNNCRILAFQPYAGEENSYTNFVLNMESVISHYSDAMLVTKGNLLTSPQQAKRQNYYKDVSQEAGNSYRLDFPDNSITEGYILFPPKKESLPMNVLTTSIDTILQQIREDNKDVILHIAKSFSESGNNRTEFDSLFLAGYGMSKEIRPLKKTLSAFKSSIPGWYFPSDRLVLRDSANTGMDYKLLLSEQEMKEVKEFIASLSAIEADYSDQAKAKRKSREQPCNCPEEDLFLPENKTHHSKVDSITPTYASTRKARKHIYRTYIKTIRDYSLCKEKKSRLKKRTLAELQQRITGLPSFTPRLNAITAKALRSKKKVTDEELDDLIGYYREKLSGLEKAEKIETGGEIYFWVDQRHLP